MTKFQQAYFGRHSLIAPADPGPKFIDKGDLEKLLSSPIADSPGVNVKESERKRTGIVRRQFCGARRARAIFRGALKVFFNGHPAVLAEGDGYRYYKIPFGNRVIAVSYTTKDLSPAEREKTDILLNGITITQAESDIGGDCGSSAMLLAPALRGNTQGYDTVQKLWSDENKSPPRNGVVV